VRPGEEGGPRVAILLCTYQGQAFLEEQLDSFLSQTHRNWRVWASDDGSSDQTLRILERYQSAWPPGRLSIVCGPRKGFAENFNSLTRRAEIMAEYYAYSDQDDLWHADKLQRALDWLLSVPADLPALYCSRTLLVDANNIEIGRSPLFKRCPSFRNALSQNIGGGNTMVMNDAARQLLCETSRQVPIVNHDWWTYLAVTGCGGRAFYDARPSVRYRQHDRNLVGMNRSLRAQLKRVRLLWRGQLRDWNHHNIAALRTLNHRLTPENRQILEDFSNARAGGLLQRLHHFLRSGTHRQTLLGNLGLITAAVFKRI
jgi:glycosyltransferase involved in cell wall biosynthesis